MQKNDKISDLTDEELKDVTGGMFVDICARASYQRKEDITTYWRTLKSNGELNIKYPEAIEL